MPCKTASSHRECAGAYALQYLVSPKEIMLARIVPQCYRPLFGILILKQSPVHFWSRIIATDLGDGQNERRISS